MTDEGFLAINTQGERLDKEVFIRILDLACRMVREDQTGAEFNIRDICTGVITITAEEANAEDASCLGGNFLVRTAIEFGNGGKTHLKFFLPKEARCLHPQVENYGEEVLERRQQHPNN